MTRNNPGGRIIAQTLCGIILISVVGAATLRGGMFSGLIELQPSSTKSEPTLDPDLPSQSPISLLEARRIHETVLDPAEPFEDYLLGSSTDQFEPTTYPGPLGEMKAMQTPVHPDGPQRAAVVWVTGGFGGLSNTFDLEQELSNDQGIWSFLQHDLVVFMPTLRGEHGNPGVFECFYGEAEDLVAAVEHVAQRPDVDPDRVFLMGHSTGGTNVLLAAMLSDAPAGVVSFGGAPNMFTVTADGEGYEVEPYDLAEPTEVWHRSPIHFTKHLQAQVLYIEGDDSFYADDALEMQQLAEHFGVPFRAALVRGGGHFSVLRPAKDLIAQHLANGHTELPTPTEIQEAFDRFEFEP